MCSVWLVATMTRSAKVTAERIPALPSKRRDGWARWAPIERCVVSRRFQRHSSSGTGRLSRPPLVTTRLHQADVRQIGRCSTERVESLDDAVAKSHISAHPPDPDVSIEKWGVPPLLIDLLLGPLPTRPAVPAGRYAIWRASPGPQPQPRAFVILGGGTQARDNAPVS